MKLRLLIICQMILIIAEAQNSTIELKDLAVPASPAFVLMDATPSIIQTPESPKSFILGISQSFQQSGIGFPQDYSAEFAPYWWINPHGKSIYNLTGIQSTRKNAGSTFQSKENPFSGLKFSTISIGFFNQDMLPDSFSTPQKIMSIGFRSTLFKIHSEDYAGKLQQYISEWHAKAQNEMDSNIDLLTEISKHPEMAAELRKQFVPSGTRELADKINELVNQKPIFSCDIAAAYATYGIGDSIWKPGRYAVWTTLSSFLPFSLNKSEASINYLNLNFSVRYLTDYYHQVETKALQKQNAFDLGGKLALETGNFSFGLESVYRIPEAKKEGQFRTVGIFNVKVSENLFINGAFGKNFDLPNKLIALFGINWGFGSESVKL